MDRATVLASAHLNGIGEEIEQIRGRLREETAAQVAQLRELLESGSTGWTGRSDSSSPSGTSAPIR